MSEEKKQLKINEIYAFCAVDPQDGQEGIIAAEINGMMMPLVCADINRVKMVSQMALNIGCIQGVEVKLKRFREVEELNIMEYLPSLEDLPETDPETTTTPSPDMSEAPHIVCPKCHVKSYSQGDIDNKFCIDCGWHCDFNKLDD